jgi:rare lipoprotein A
MGTFFSFAQVQQGEASFYKDVFEGRKTASGEIFQQDLPTAAHRSLPFGTLVKITNQANGKSVEVRINDRGPFIRNRILDVSKSVAEELDFVNQGIALIELEVISFASNTSTSELPSNTDTGEIGNSPNPQSSVATTSVSSASTLEEKFLMQIQNQPNTEQYFNLQAEPISPSFYSVQLASFSEINNAIQKGNEIEALFREDVSLRYKLLNQKALFTLILGKLQTRTQADALKAKVSNQFPDAFVVKF